MVFWKARKNSRTALGDWGDEGIKAFDGGKMDLN